MVIDSVLSGRCEVVDVVEAGEKQRGDRFILYMCDSVDADNVGIGIDVGFGIGTCTDP